ncbi:hypothetical protein EUGRSUZ_E00466 [Eucalyptus grandis]|uniref:Uncharacterized protein n=2 Tax=Eucalyptus grandis TaxID=71139 RepID=A0ACC3KRV6_EUCGR|nr:hypothetical protein EUGRSUZ_E00466 [Eucalyptus grandis]
MEKRNGKTCVQSLPILPRANAATPRWAEQTITNSGEWKKEEKQQPQPEGVEEEEADTKLGRHGLTESPPYKPSRLHPNPSSNHLAPPSHAQREREREREESSRERNMATTSRRAMPLLPAAAAAALLLLLAAALAGAQTPAQTCVSKLTDCAAYLNTTTTPPDTCCTPLKEVVNTQLTCLCNVLKSPGLLISMGIDVQKALQLTTRCGVSTDTSKCNGTATPPSSSTTRRRQDSLERNLELIPDSGIDDVLLRSTDHVAYI